MSQMNQSLHFFGTPRIISRDRAGCPLIDGGIPLYVFV